MSSSGSESLGSFDYVIAGGGSAGCLLANRLSADPSVSVALLEAGGLDDYFWIHVPMGLFKTIGNPRTDWRYKSEPEPGLGERVMPVPRGFGLGGCSLINGMVYVRGQARDYDEWRALGNTGWSWQEVLPHFKRFENYCHGADAWHGADGELRVEEPRVRWKILDALLEGAREAGVPATSDFNRGDNEGAAYCQVTQRRGVRASASRSFLHPVTHRPNLRVITGAHAKRVRFKHRRAIGVEFLAGNEARFAEARAEVIVASGAIGSPQLLQLSGVGNESLLNDKQVSVVHHLPGVGENLQDHLMLRMTARVRNARSLNQLLPSPLGRAGMGLLYFLFKRGPMTVIPPQGNVFTRSNPARETANIQVQMAPASYDRMGEPFHPWPGVTLSVCNVRPSSRGNVRIKSSDALQHPAILHNYLSTEDDQRVAVESLRFNRRLLASRALERFQPEEYRPGAAAQSDADLLGFARDHGTTVFHPVGTCKMGRDAHAVVDERLRVYGLQALRVVDASVMPTITSANTHAPTLMIAEKGAAMILEDRRGVLSPAAAQVEARASA